MLFFFNQKTAYEMRISDWSSDVCSSDLLESAIIIDAARVQPFRQAVDALQVVRLDIGGKAVFAVVGDRDRLVLAVEFHHHDRGAENLDLADLVIGVRVDDQRRLDEIAVGKLAAAAAADQHELRRALGLRSEERRVGKGCVSKCSNRW